MGHHTATRHRVEVNMEDKRKRFDRLLSGSFVETQATVLNALGNRHAKAVRYLAERVADAPDTFEAPLFLTMHAVIQTVAEQLFLLSGLNGTRFYLERFVDPVGAKAAFSSRATEIHEMRNDMAHGWTSQRGHDRALDYDEAAGVGTREGIPTVNPVLLGKQFADGFDAEAPIWEWDSLGSTDQFEAAKYLFLVRWLDPPHGPHKTTPVGRLKKQLKKELKDTGYSSPETKAILTKLHTELEKVAETLA